MKKMYIILLLMSNISIYAQLLYPVVGVYKNKSAQGMAIWGDSAYLMNNEGRCRVYNLRTCVQDREFMLASADSTNHINSVCFGKEKLGNNDRPVLYLSECRNMFRCFVECLTDSGAVLVQTIECKGERGKIEKVLDWIVDVENNWLYAITRNEQELKTSGIVYNYISKYRLPRLNEGSIVVLDTKEKIDFFEVVFPNIIQGAKIRNNFLYIVTGLAETSRTKRGSKRALQVVNLEKQRIERVIDLTRVSMNEPEDIDFYNNKCLLFCGQNGGIYNVDY